jgi:hypothetical protein
MGLAKFDEAGAFGIARDLALKRDGTQFVGGAVWARMISGKVIAKRPSCGNFPPLGIAFA